MIGKSELKLTKLDRIGNSLLILFDFLDTQWKLIINCWVLLKEMKSADKMERNSHLILFDFFLTHIGKQERLL